MTQIWGKSFLPRRVTATLGAMFGESLATGVIHTSDTKTVESSKSAGTVMSTESAESKSGEIRFCMYITL